jgi:hypothetical protein
VYGAHATKESSVLNDTGSSGKDQNLHRMTHEVGSQKRKGHMQIWTEYEPGALISKIWCEANSRSMLRESARRRPELLPDEQILHHGNGLRVPDFLAKESLQKWITYLAELT